jgi:hypothetical protein
MEATSRKLSGRSLCGISHFLIDANRAKHPLGALLRTFDQRRSLCPGDSECYRRLGEIPQQVVRRQINLREETQRVRPAELRIGATGERAGLAREFGIAATDLRERAKRIRRRKGRAGDRARRRGSADLGFIGRWRSD